MEGYTSIRLIADDVLDHPMLQDVTFERIINYAVKFMRKVGIPNSFVETAITVLVDLYRAALPCDFYKMVAVSKDGKPLRHTTDNFHMQLLDNIFSVREDTYKVQGRVLFTSFREGDLDIVYRAIPVDEDGYPLIPDNDSYILALEAYIKVLAFEVLFDLGKIAPLVLEKAEQKYAWEVGLASTHMIMPTPDLMESITSMMTAMIPRVNEHKRGFATLGSKEYIRRQ